MFLLWVKLLRCSKPSNKIHEMPQEALDSCILPVFSLYFIIFISFNKVNFRRKNNKNYLNQDLISLMSSEHSVK